MTTPTHPPTWRQMNADTSPEAEAVLLRLWRETPAWRKWQMAETMNATARELALAGLRGRHPDASPEELRRRLADLVLGVELAAVVYGPGPDRGAGPNSGPREDSVASPDARPGAAE